MLFRSAILRRLQESWQPTEEEVSNTARLGVHWYPLRFPSLPTDSSSSDTDSANELWDPRTLSGLWLGAYSMHGTEVLYLTYNEEAEEVQAWKITGDLNVPRGVMSWRFKCSGRRGRKDESGTTPDVAQDGRSSGDWQLPVDDALLTEFDIGGTDVQMKAKVRLYAGTGTVSQTGFT